MSEPNQGFPPQLPPEPGQPAPQQEAPPNYGSPHPPTMAHPSTPSRFPRGYHHSLTPATIPQLLPLLTAAGKQKICF